MSTNLAEPTETGRRLTALFISAAQWFAQAWIPPTGIRAQKGGDAMHPRFGARIAYFRSIATYCAILMRIIGDLEQYRLGSISRSDLRPMKLLAKID